MVLDSQLPLVTVAYTVPPAEMYAAGFEIGIVPAASSYQ